MHFQNNYLLITCRLQTVGIKCCDISRFLYTNFYLRGVHHSCFYHFFFLIEGHGYVPSVLLFLSQLLVRIWWIVMRVYLQFSFVLSIILQFCALAGRLYSADQAQSRIYSTPRSELPVSLSSLFLYVLCCSKAQCDEPRKNSNCRKFLDCPNNFFYNFFFFQFFKHQCLGPNMTYCCFLLFLFRRLYLCTGSYFILQSICFMTVRWPYVVLFSCVSFVSFFHLY